MKKLLLPVALVIFVCGGCAVRSADQVVDRNEVPAVAPNVPAGNSEIREIAFKKVAGESAHKDLHLRGMLFTKRESGGNVDIVPCSGCIVKLKGLQDTSIVIRMTTESDGFFSFHGATGSFILALENPNHNTVFISPIKFDAGGVNTLVLVNASGNSTERFNVTQTNRTYTWTRQ